MRVDIVQKCKFNERFYYIEAVIGNFPNPIVVNLLIFVAVTS